MYNMDHFNLIFSGGEIFSDNNISGGSSGDFSCTSLDLSAVETLDNVFVSLSDSIASSYEISGAEIADSGVLNGTDLGDKIFDTSVFVIFVSSDALGLSAASESSATCFALSNIFVFENENGFCGKQFFIRWIYKQKGLCFIFFFKYNFQL